MSFATVGAAAVCLLLALVWWFTPTYRPDEPAPIPHAIPVLGHLIPFVSNRRAFFRWGQQKSGGQPWSAYIAGRKHYVFSKPGDITAVFRKSKVLSIKGFLRHIYATLFGMSQTEVAQLMSMSDASHEVNSMLLKPEYYNRTALRYFQEIRKGFGQILDEVDVSATKSVTKDAFSLVMDVQATSTVTAYFGRRLLQLNPQALRQMTTFAADGFWPLLTMTPSILIQKVYAIRQRIVANLKEIARTARDEGDVSDYVREKVKVAQEHRLGEDAVGKDEFGFLFGLFTNSSPTTYIAMLRIIETPGLLQELRAEIDEARVTERSDEELVRLVPHQLPRLRALFFEVLRWHSGSLLLREVLETTTLVSKVGDGAGGSQTKVYHLEKGAVVDMPSMLAHFEPDVHPEPERFEAKRFLSTDLGGRGTNPSTTIRAFGGGPSYCPGRVFAERQVIGFLALLFGRFDVAFANDDWQMPEGHDFEAVVLLRRAHLKLSRRM